MVEEADALIRKLSLMPHPEGGHYRETFRDESAGDGRALSTAIYFLLKAGEESRWHRIDCAEVWHWYAGGPLQLLVSDSGTLMTHLLGNDIAAGQLPQVIVPPRAWQSARPLGAFSLVGCTVAPGFLLERFELAPTDFSPER